MKEESNNNNNNNKDKKKIVALITLIITLVFSTTGATYAYFALSAVNNNVISGTSATVGGTLTVSRILPTDANWNTSTKVMVPQLSANTTKRTNALKTAIDGGCVDANSNVVCQVYRIAYVNQSTADVRINSSLALDSTMTNLRWYSVKEENGIDSVPTSPTYVYPTAFTTKYGNAQSVTSLGSSQSLASSKYRYWDVAIWIEETGNDQYGVDGARNFTGVVSIQATDSAGAVVEGITSTFTG